VDMRQGTVRVRLRPQHRSPDRTLIRVNGQFRKAPWEVALDTVAQVLKKVKEEQGLISIAFLVSAKCTNEENYLLQKLARAAIGTNNVDHCARL